MISAFKLLTDCDSHSACHSLEKAILEAFPGTEMSLTEHDINCRVCRYDGEIFVGGSSYPFSFQQGLQRDIEFAIDLSSERSMPLMLEIMRVYAAKLDAGGHRHTLELN